MPRTPKPSPSKRRTKANDEGTKAASVTEAPKARISYSQELAARICKEMLERDEDDKTRSLRDVCKFDGMPSESAVYSWLIDHAEFAEMYARARETLADMNASDVLKIADTATDANLARVRIDARKWWAAKVAPKKYGDKIGISGDGDGSPILMQSIDRPEKESREEWVARRARELGTAALGASARPAN
jgi:hypothetical protein